MKTSAWQIFHLGVLAFELLDIVFAELAQTQGVSFVNRTGGEDFGHRQQEDFRARPAGLAASLLEAVFQFGKAVSEG